VYNFSEGELHERFKNTRLRGEWFTPDESLLSFIKENAVKPDCFCNNKDYNIETNQLNIEINKIANYGNRSSYFPPTR
jgi:hypothetical protein